MSLNENEKQCLFLINMVIENGDADSWTNDQLDIFLQEYDSVEGEILDTFVYCPEKGSVCTLHDIMLEYNVYNIIDDQ